MKLNNLFSFAAALSLPLSFVSCGGEEKEDEKKEEKGVQTPEYPAKRDHTQIGEDIGVVMNGLMESMSSISDKKSAEEFVAGFGEKKASLAALWEEAKTLDLPTAEEKAAVQSIKNASDKKGEALLGNLMKMMTESPDAEAIGEILGSVMNDKEMEEVTEELEALYDLKDSSAAE
jgi:hypothetical protein